MTDLRVDDLDLTNLPLWRVPQVTGVVLPGFQQVLHVRAPHHVKLFEHQLSPVAEDRGGGFFGQLVGPEASTEASRVGVLMRLTSMQRHSGGSLTVISQAVCRFMVRSHTHEGLFPRVAVQLLPDEEGTLETPRREMEGAKSAVARE